MFTNVQIWDSTILETLWKEGKDTDLTSLINAIQNPPMNKVEVLDIESFFPVKDRFKLVMSLNNLVASPSFSSWIEGVDFEWENCYTIRMVNQMSQFSTQLI